MSYFVFEPSTGQTRDTLTLPHAEKIAHQWRKQARRDCRETLVMVAQVVSRLYYYPDTLSVAAKAKVMAQEGES